MRKGARNPRLTPPTAFAPLDLGRLARTEAEHWVGRLIQRKYTEGIRRIAGPEYSAQIEHEGIRFFFPLGSADPQIASLRAAEIYSCIIRDGWPATLARWPREIAVAIFWSWSPLACTYTTLYSLPDPPLAASGRTRGRRPGSVRHVALVEPEPGIQRALVQCVNRQRGFACSAVWDSGADALSGLPSLPVDLLLVNRSLAERPGDDLLHQIRSRHPEIPVYTFGIYEESNYIFHSVAGVKAGYILHRRTPDCLLEPVARITRETAPALSTLAADIKYYFQSLFDLPSSDLRDPELSGLTRRERDILNCLAQGRTDKEISDALRISVWTVHGHVKNIFEKLRVHSRTEAVVKYLQK
jgi:DNA-binding NarL/FixJ family response regulator